MAFRSCLGASSVFVNLCMMILNMLAFGIGIYLDSSVDVHKHFIAGSRYDLMVRLIMGTGIILSVTNFLGVMVCSCALMTSAGRGGCGSWLAMQMLMLFVFAWLLLATGVVMMMVGGYIIFWINCID